MSRSRSRSPDRRNERERSRSRSRSRSNDRARRERERDLNPEELFTVMVQGFPTDTRRSELEDYFGKFGELAEINIPLDYHTRRPRGLAFIRFFKKDDQQAVVDEHDREKLRIGGRDLRCEFAYSKPKPGDSRYRRSPPRRSYRSPSPRRGGGRDRYDDRRDDRRDDRYGRDRYDDRRDDRRRDDRRDDRDRYDDRRRR